MVPESRLLSNNKSINAWSGVERGLSSYTVKKNDEYISCMKGKERNSSKDERGFEANVNKVGSSKV